MPSNSNLVMRPLAGFAVKLVDNGQVSLNTENLREDLLVAMKQDADNIATLLAGRYGISTDEVTSNFPVAVGQAAEWLMMEPGARRDLFLKLAREAAEATLSTDRPLS